MGANSSPSCGGQVSWGGAVAHGELLNEILYSEETPQESY